VAKEYVCAQLAVMGGPATTVALGELLAQPELAHAATNALQVMPGPEAVATLRASLGRLAGLPLIGVITALGMRRDADSVVALERMLADTDNGVASAAAAALGEIGSMAAARALGAFLSQAPLPLRPALGDACLVGAARVRAAGGPIVARALLDALLATEPPGHVRAAALRLIR
jgi:hypothetical protein